MRPLKGSIIIKTDLEQKSVLQYGTLRLYMPPKQELLSTDGRIGNPVVAEVVVADADYPHLIAGDLILLNHNVLNNEAYKIMEQGSAERTLVIPVNKSILAKITQDGEVIPVCENLVCERVMEPDISSIIITPDAYKKPLENTVRVVSASPEAAHLEAGMEVIIYKYSDYEATFNINGERRNVIIVYVKDVIAVDKKEVA